VEEEEEVDKEVEEGEVEGGEESESEEEVATSETLLGGYNSYTCEVAEVGKLF
jgi:hypothetical protein